MTLTPAAAAATPFPMLGEGWEPLRVFWFLSHPPSLGEGSIPAPNTPYAFVPSAGASSGVAGLVSFFGIQRRQPR
jgi:hypothetical protein